MELTVEMTRATTKRELEDLIDDIMERYHVLYIELLEIDEDMVTISVVWDNKIRPITTGLLMHFIHIKLEGTSELDRIESDIEENPSLSLVQMKNKIVSILSEYIHDWIKEGE